jgi:mRNA interferase MazF
MFEDYMKDYPGWMGVKRNLDEQEMTQFVRPGEIRWASLGINVGSEIDGKGASFTRPVLIVSVVGKHLALILPITSKIKDLPGYVSFEYADNHDALCIHQIRVISQKRIFNRISKISETRLEIYKEKIKSFFYL